ncbi:hypothetical protein EV175_004665 [Coemansia sp. RSA 1933]|nr:hypothetical protein EV175_004665 [Coemansia sp. RSA 1933]
MDAVDRTTAEYLDALSTIDQSIRSLIDGTKTQPKQPPTLQTELHMEDDDATVVFLCSSLPHYEGMAGVDFSDLCAPLPFSTDHEEPVPDSAWGTSSNSSNMAPLELQSDMTPLASPQTLAPGEDEDEEDRRLAAYEGWIDFDALADAARDALGPLLLPNTAASSSLRIGHRTETDYMLTYAVRIAQSQSQSQSQNKNKNNDDDTRWVVQVPKPAVPIPVFVSEIVSIAYAARNSCLPVPTIVAHDFSPSNAAGVPYAVLEQPPGEPLALLWPDLDMQQKRCILDQIASSVVQLSRLRLPLIGSLVPSDDGELIVGPLLCARDLEPGYAAGAGGPFASTHVYLDALLQASDAALEELDDDMSRTEVAMYRANVARFVDQSHDAGPFVLMPESLDMHHFTVDRRSLRLSGLVDWTFSSVRPLQSLAQPPPFVFDDTPRWEPLPLDMRLAHRRNLLRYRTWFVELLIKCAWPVLGSTGADELVRLARHGYWRYKFEHEAAENIRFSNPWSFRALWEHLHPDKQFALWLCDS